ncbi:M23 family metallopeptidase [bacterium]|nr:M23 family metallopeptidase [bacterium]
MRIKEKEILIIPRGQGNIRKLHLTKPLQALILSIFSILLISFIFLSYDYISLKRQMDDYIRIIEENQMLTGENQIISDNLLSMVVKYERVKLFEEEVSLLLGMNKNPKESLGGPGLYSLYHDSYNTERLNGIRESIVQSLKSEFSKKEDSFIKIKEFIYKNNSLICATPSIWPVKGYISSGFHYRTHPLTGKRVFHKGLDIAGPTGTPVRATADGIVTRSENNPYGFGKLIEIKHGFGFSTKYAHLNTLDVKVGQVVKRGHIIATRGSTGNSSGPHLHYEVRINNKAVNPVNFILDYNME